MLIAAGSMAAGQGATWRMQPESDLSENRIRRLQLTHLFALGAEFDQKWQNFRQRRISGSMGASAVYHSLRKP